MLHHLLQLVKYMYRSTCKYGKTELEGIINYLWHTALSEPDNLSPQNENKIYLIFLT